MLFGTNCAKKKNASGTNQRDRLHRAALVDVADTTFLEDPGALTYRSDDRPDTYSPCLCSFLDPLQRTDPLDFDKHWPRGSI